MDQEAHHIHPHPSSSSSSSSSSTATATPIDAPSSTSSVTAAPQLQQQESNEQTANGNNSRHQHLHHSSSSSYPYYSGPPRYRVNISISNMPPCEMRHDVWSCFTVLVTFWFFVSMTLILGLYGSVNLELGPYCSRLIKTNPLFVQSITVEEAGEPKHGPMLYGFYKPPPMDVEINWTQAHNTIVPIDFHKEWVYFLNKGSKLDIFYNIKSPSSSPLSLVIAEGRKSLAEWIEDPSYPKSNIIFGSGKIEQEISKSSNYYIAVGNLNSEDVEVELKFTVKTLIYNTSQSYYMCSLGHRLCTLRLFLLGTNVAVLTSPSSEEGALNDDWYIKISYGPRWITYFVGSGVMVLLILFTLRMRYCNMFQASSGDGIQEGDNLRIERAPLLSPKADDMSSWGSSYDSISQEEQDLDEFLAMNSAEGKHAAEGENLRCLCVICFDAPRDCFFLPCGHCAACFTCGCRLAEEAGTCPICRRSMKKVRKVFTV